MAKFQVGKHYVARLKDQRSVEVLRELSFREKNDILN